MFCEKFFYKAVTASWRWPMRVYGVLEAWSCIPMDFYRRLTAVWLWRAKIFTLHTLCAQSVYRVYKKFMWHSDIRKDSERSPAKRSRLITASILQLCALLERANEAIYLALDAAFDTLITRSHSANTTPFRFYCVLSKRRVAMRTLCMLKVCVVAWRSMRLYCDKSRCRCGVAPK